MAALRAALLVIESGIWFFMKRFGGARWRCWGDGDGDGVGDFAVVDSSVLGF